ELMVCESGVFREEIANDGTGTTSATGTASVILKALTVANCVNNGTNATLTNGTYDLYFAIRSATDTASAALAGTPCANGHLQYSSISATFLTLHGSVAINGDSTYSISNTNALAGLQHKFDIQAGAPGANFRCFVTDVNVTTFTATTPPLASYQRTGIGTMTGNGGQTNLLPAGTYKYFCYADMNSNVAFFDTGDK